MSDKRETPAEWQKLMDRKGLSSARRLGTAAGVHYSTINRIMHGDGPVPKAKTLDKIADALDVDPQVVYALVDSSFQETKPWSPPEASRTLTGDEREALDRLIRLMTAGRLKEGDSDEPENALPGVHVLYPLHPEREPG